MYTVNNQYIFSNYAEAKCALLARIESAIEHVNSSLTDKSFLENWRKSVRISISNHDKDIKALCHPFQNLNENDKAALEHIINQNFINTISQSPYQALKARDLLDNHLLREIESALPIALLKNPTQAMLENAKSVSDNINKIIRLYSSNNFNYQNICKAKKWQPINRNNLFFTDNFTAFALGLINAPLNQTHSGGFSLDEINTYFKANRIPLLTPEILSSESLNTQQLNGVLRLTQETLDENKNLERTMYIHYVFSTKLMKDIPIPSSFTQSLNTIENDLAFEANIDRDTYNQSIQQPSDSGEEARLFYVNHFLRSDYYAHDREKGHAGRRDARKTTQFYGLFTNDNIQQLKDFKPRVLTKSALSQSWSPDAVSQSADKMSPVVLSNLNHDTVYISGPSEALAYLMASYKLLTPSSTLKSQQIYLQNILAYAVGTGLNSTHEILGPAEFLLQLIPGYQVAIPDYKGDMPAPTFNTFYEIAKSNDPEFDNRLDTAWRDIADFFNTAYLHTPCEYQLSEKPVLVATLFKDMSLKHLDSNSSLDIDEQSRVNNSSKPS